MWHERVGPWCWQAHPCLKPHQGAAIEEDYAMVDHRFTFSVRKALLFYVQKFLRLDYPDEGMLSEAKPLCAVNGEVFSAQAS